MVSHRQIAFSLQSIRSLVRTWPVCCEFRRFFGSESPTTRCRSLHGSVLVCRLLFSLATPTPSSSRFSGRCTCRSCTLAKFGTATVGNHFFELIVPWFSFGPRSARHIAGILLVSFQIVLIISGNLSFLNYVTIIPFLACFDDTFLRRFLPKSVVRRAEQAAQQSEPSRINNTIAIAL